MTPLCMMKAVVQCALIIYYTFMISEYVYLLDIYFVPFRVKQLQMEQGSVSTFRLTLKGKKIGLNHRHLWYC